MFQPLSKRSSALPHPYVWLYFPMHSQVPGTLTENTGKHLVLCFKKCYNIQALRKRCRVRQAVKPQPSQGCITGSNPVRDAMKQIKLSSREFFYILYCRYKISFITVYILIDASCTLRLAVCCK